jgi:hypothetical protein
MARSSPSIYSDTSLTSYKDMSLSATTSVGINRRAMDVTSRTTRGLAAFMAWRAMTGMNVNAGGRKRKAPKECGSEITNLKDAREWLRSHRLKIWKDGGNREWHMAEASTHSGRALWGSEGRVPNCRVLWNGRVPSPVLVSHVPKRPFWNQAQPKS